TSETYTYDANFRLIRAKLERWSGDQHTTLLATRDGGTLTLARENAADGSAREVSIDADAPLDETFAAWRILSRFQQEPGESTLAFQGIDIASMELVDRELSIKLNTLSGRYTLSTRSPSLTLSGALDAEGRASELEDEGLSGYRITATQTK